MPTYSELFIDRDGTRQNVLIVSFDYVEAGLLCFGLLVVLFYFFLACGYHFWPTVFAPLVEPFQDQANQRNHGRNVVPRVAPAGGAAARQ